MTEASILDSRQTRFQTLQPLKNQPPESSIAHLFPNTSIRNRPLIGKSALTNYDTFTTSSASQAPRQVLHSLLETLRDSKIPGPRLIRLRQEFNKRIGEGAQCDVFAASDDFETLLKESPSDRFDWDTEWSLRACKFLAVKQTKTANYGRGSENTSSGVNISRGLREQFEYAQRDILTLCKEPIRRHPNIVKLLYWGLCLDTLEDPKGDSPRIPLLVLERANGNLGEYLQNEIEFENDHSVFATEQCKLCLDIGRGLEAIHKMKMTHGDLKLSNVLIYQSSFSVYGATAKLCDFGLAIEEKKGEEIFTDYLGTPGWRPPESDETLPSSSLVLCDVFAYGLVVWCVATLNLKSPIEGLTPRSLTEHHLYNRAFEDIPRAGILRSGQDTNRILRVLLGSLNKKPLLRERQPWRYLDRAQYPLIAAAVDPTRGSASLLAFNMIMQAIQWVGATSRKSRLKVQSSWAPLLSSCWYVCNVLVSTVRWLILWIASRPSVLEKTFTRLMHSRAASPRQETYEQIVKNYAKSLGREMSGTGPDGTDIMDNALSATCDIGGIQKRLEDEISRLDKIPRVRDRTSEIPLLAYIFKTHDFRNNTRRANSENIVYALARLRSRFALPAWDSGVSSGLRSESGSPLPINRSIQSSDSHKLGSNAVIRALDLYLDVQTIAWLCKGPVGRREITNSMKSSLWRTTYEATDDSTSRARRIQIIAVLLQIGAEVDDCVSDAGLITAFGRILRNLVTEDIREAERSETTILVCRYFKRAALRSGSPRSRYFFTGELPDESDLDETGAFLTTALHEAVLACSYPAVQYLLSYHFPIYIQNRQGQIPFELAKSMPLDTTSSRIKLNKESRRILELIRPTASADISKSKLPLGWTAKHLSSGRQVYEELHTSSITFRAPSFSLWQERRLTLGFKQLSSIGQSFLIDPVRFVGSGPGVSDEVSSDESFNFDDRWFRTDIRNTKRGPTDASRMSWLMSSTPVFRLYRLTNQVLWSLKCNYVNFALVFLPFSLVGPKFGWSNGVVVLFNSLTIVPIYSLHRFALRQMNAYHSEYVKSTVTAVSDSAVDVILGIVAVLHGQTSMAKDILIGIICNNVLLILGTSFLVAGIRQFQSPFNYQLASTRSALLNLAIAFLLMVYTIGVVLSPLVDVPAPIITGVSIILVILYILYIFFRYKTHAALYDNAYWVDDYQPDISDAPEFDVTNTDRQHRNLSNNDDYHSSSDVPEISYFTAGFLALFSCSLLVYFANSTMTHIILTGIATSRLYGLFVIPVCLKATLHFDVILDASTGKMESALATTTNGALRAMYLLFPMLIFLSRMLGYSMDMTFALDEIIVTALATFILAPIAARGTSTFLDGGLLLLICIIVYLEQYLRIVYVEEF